VIEIPSYMNAQPAVGTLPPLHPPVTTEFRLRNGLEVVAIARAVAPIVSMSLMIRSGADGDPPGLEGLASAAGEMLDEGAGPRNALEIAEVLEQLGADLYVGAGRDGSQLTLQVPSKELEAALAISADVVMRPRLTSEDWHRVQHDRLTALAQRRDQPESVANLVSDRILFGEGHPYCHPVDGVERSISALTIDDIRAFHQQIWRPNSATVVVAGDFDPARLPEQLERAFGEWEPRPVPTPRPTPGFPALPRLVLIDRPGAPQSVIRMIGAGEVRTSPDRPALGMLNAIFGGSFTSRLNFNLREQKGYTYGAGSSFGFYRRAGAFTARAAVFTEVTAPSVTEFLRELNSIREALVTPVELTKARATLLGRVAEGLSTSGGVAAQYAELRLYGLPLDEPARFAAALADADGARLQQLALRHLDPERMAIVIVGDRAVIEPTLREIGLPEPLIRDADGAPLPPAAG
jgi:predicted Zn-dependent peptidase